VIGLRPPTTLVASEDVRAVKPYDIPVTTMDSLFQSQSTSRLGETHPQRKLSLWTDALFGKSQSIINSYSDPCDSGTQRQTVA